MRTIFLGQLLNPRPSLLIFLSLISLSLGVYRKEDCEYRSTNYSLEWAYEPITKNVVFLLKANVLNERSKDGDGYWTGVGFGNEKTQDLIDFVGIYARTGQVGLTDGHLDPNTGGFVPDLAANVQTLSLRMGSGGSVVAKFARPIVVASDEGGGGEDVDLTECTSFHIPTKPIPAAPKGKELSNGDKVGFTSLKRLNVCGIADKCRVEFAGTKKNSEESNEQLDVAKLKSDEKLKKEKSVEIAHSVDVSGRGDPCSFTAPAYSVNWSYNSATDRVNFVMRHPVKEGHWWSAVGIGDNMSDMDIGILFLDNGRLQKMADFYSDSYDVPDEDVQQDWSADQAKSRVNGDQVELHFSRAIITKDKEKDRSLDGCVLFQFAANGATYGPNFHVHKHDDWPDLYKACDLRKRCVRQNGGERLVVSQSVDANETVTVDQATDGVKNGTTVEDADLTNQKQEPRDEQADRVISILTQKHKRVDNFPKDENEISEPQKIEANSEDLQNSNNHTEAVLPTDDANASIETEALRIRPQPSNETSDEDKSSEATTEEPGTKETEAPKRFKIADLLRERSENDTSTTKTPDEQTTEATSDHAKIDSEGSTNSTSLKIGDEKPSESDEDATNELNGSSPFDAGNSTAKESEKTDPGASEQSPNITVPEQTNNTVADANQVNQTDDKGPIDPQTALAASKSGENVSLAINEENNNQTTTTVAVNITESQPSTNSPESITTGVTTTTEVDASTGGDVDNAENGTITTTTSELSFPQTTKLSQQVGKTVTELQNVGEESAGNSTVSETPSGRKLPVSEGGCDVLKPDLEVCQSYMDNYIARVKDWADRHNELLEDQYGKACKLLSAVPHVPTLCCQIYTEKCHGQL